MFASVIVYVSCIQEWFKKRHTCLTCRHAYPKQDIRHVMQRNQENVLNQSIFEIVAQQLKYILREREVSERKLYSS